MQSSHNFPAFPGDRLVALISRYAIEPISEVEFGRFQFI